VHWSKTGDGDEGHAHGVAWGAPADPRGCSRLAAPPGGSRRGSSTPTHDEMPLIRGPHPRASGSFPEMGVFAPPSSFFKKVECVRETDILLDQQPLQGVFVCDHAGLVINKLYPPASGSLRLEDQTHAGLEAQSLSHVLYIPEAPASSTPHHFALCSQCRNGQTSLR